MNLSYFIAKRLSFKGKLASIAIALSFFIIIIAVAISSGFRSGIREGISDISGDIQILPFNLNVLDETNPIERNPTYLDFIKEHRAVEDVTPVVYRAGIIKAEDKIHGVLFKGSPNKDSVQLGASIPRRLADILELEVGDDLLSYFVGKRLRARKFRITSIYNGLVELDDKLIIHANIEDIQRINSWEENEISAFHLKVKDNYKSPEALNNLCQEIGVMTASLSSEDEMEVIVKSSVSEYPQIFDWLNLIDFNVVFILILMIIVAGFNMISGLLILLFENISTIGVLKSMGMKNREIAKVFLTTSSFLILRGMVIGNILAFILCFIQAKTHIISLNPSHYLLSYIPIELDIVKILIADVMVYFTILLLLLIPSRFISSVDPAQTIRIK